MAKRKKDTEPVVNQPAADAPAKPTRAARAKAPAAPKSAKTAKPAVVPAAAPTSPAPASSTPMAVAAAEPAWPGPAVEPATASNGRPSEDRIASRAYEIYQSRGGAHGDPLQDWLQAEREIKGSR